MCGIAGLISLDTGSPPPEGEVIVRRMLADLAHRGPDGEGLERSGPAVLGHRRLSIIDLEGGAQPISDASGQVMLVFNGEIYNFMELRQRLSSRGHRFRTRSDSEVLAAALAEWGAQALPELRGMFAFAAWDQTRRRLILARDRLGKKPLYWARRGDLVAFASELPALLAWPAIAMELDEQSLANYLRYGYIASPRSAVRDVHKLPAGATLEIGAGVGVPRRYWDVHYRPKWDEPPALLPLLDSAVADRLIADVPVGAFLSGGLDSALVVARAAQKGTLRTFTVGFGGAEQDEREPARALADWAGARHVESELRLDVASHIDAVVRRLGEPLGDPSALPTYLVAGLARGQVKVVLTGDGGDETFAGYHRYARTRLSLLYPRLPSQVRGLARRALRFAGASPARLAELEARARRPPGQTYADAMSVFDAGDAMALLHPDRRRAPEPLLERSHDQCDGDWLDRLMYTDLRNYLSESVLVKVDRMTMAHGIEARSPLLDHRLVELAARMPGAWKRPPGSAGKQPLRQLAAQLFPAKLIDRPKRGFDIPMKSWMSGGPLRRSIEEVLRESLLVRDGWLAKGPLLAEIAPDRDGMARLGNRIWSLYILELWYRQRRA